MTEKNQPGSFFERVKNLASRDHMPLRGEQDGRINVLLLGLAGENYPGENLTDSIIIASINPKTYQTAMLSIPRDLFVQIPDTNSYTKINALYARGKDKTGKDADGVEDLRMSLSEITALPIHYYIALDFDSFQQIIDELGGINIQVPKDIHDKRYPGPNYSYETFDIAEGLHNLDGATALKYARTRHDEDGDFGRAYHQQQILESVRSKAFSLGTILNIPKINGILDTLGENLRTDIELEELDSFLDLTEKIDTHTTVNYVLNAGKPESILAVSHVYLGGVRAFILIPRTGDYDEVHDVAKNIFDLEVIERKKKEIANENASVAIINRSGVYGLDSKLSALLKKFGYNSSTIRLSSRTTDPQTTVFDLTNGLKPFSLEDLAKKFSAKIENGGSTSIMEVEPPADFILIAGPELGDKLNYEEDSVADLERGYDQQSIDERGYIELLKKGSNKKF
ncbi:MAG: LCP family protein [Candidatus Aminicenantes bacterium]|nr:LCP family protein [Candidatus Aminicenantes bacterium]